MKVCCKCNEEIYPGQLYKGSGKQKRHFKPDCGHAQSVSAGELAPLPPEGAVLRPLGATERMLGSRVALSEKERECHTCAEAIRAARKLAELSGHVSLRFEFEEMQMNQIRPGDTYERRVYRALVGEPWENRTRLVARFFHYPHCPIFYDDPENCTSSCSVHQIRRKRRAGVSPLRRAA